VDRARWIVDELCAAQRVVGRARLLGRPLLGISVDSAWCHSAFAQARKLHFPLLADFEPKGAVSRLYNAYRSHEGTSERALYVIDGEGIIRWSYCSPVGVNPGADGILEALESLGASSSAGAAR
jgi:peroxiredoxin